MYIFCDFLNFCVLFRTSSLKLGSDTKYKHSIPGNVIVV